MPVSLTIISTLLTPGTIHYLSSESIVMHFFLKALPLLAFATAHPIEKRGSIEKRALSDDDTAVLSLALYLEHLEYALYSSAYE